MLMFGGLVLGLELSESMGFSYELGGAGGFFLGIWVGMRIREIIINIKEQNEANQKLQDEVYDLRSKIKDLEDEKNKRS